MFKWGLYLPTSHSIVFVCDRIFFEKCGWETDVQVLLDGNDAPIYFHGRNVLRIARADEERTVGRQVSKLRK